MALRLAEANLVKRARTLAPGVYLVAITVDAGGVECAAFLASGKEERLRTESDS